MCGIAGGVGTNPPDKYKLDNQLKVLAHRGPDEKGSLNGKNFSFGICRLSIVEIESGQQPVSDRENQVHVVFNGEIYNHFELRKNISISGPNLKDLTGIFQIEGLKKFRFRTNPENYSIYINLPILNDSRQIEMLISILSNSDYSDRDKKLLIPLLGDTLYDYFEKNPLELYLLDSLPELKKDILQKRNIPDVGKLGDVLNKGFL